jgi:hypothetical protein
VRPSFKSLKIWFYNYYCFLHPKMWEECKAEVQSVRKVAVHFKSCWKWCPRTIVSKNWIKQLHTSPVLHFAAVYQLGTVWNSSALQRQLQYRQPNLRTVAYGHRDFSNTLYLKTKCWRSCLDREGLECGNNRVYIANVFVFYGVCCWRH